MDVFDPPPTLTVTVSNSAGPAPVNLSLQTPDGAFSIASPTDLPVTVSRCQSQDVEITFAPPGLGPFSGTLQVLSDDADAPVIDVPINGTAVVSGLPSEQFDDLLAFFDASVAAGTLVGNGNGNSGDGRLGALRNMIVAAGDLIDQGLDACGQLQAALNQTDGAPPDFVAGEATSELAFRIRILMDSLGCP